MATAKQGRSFLRTVTGISAGACALSVVAATQLQMHEAVPYAIGSGVATLAFASISLLLLNHRKNRSRLAALLAVKFGPEWDPVRGVQLKKFENRAPMRVIVDYPDQMPDHKPEWRAEIRELVRVRMGVDSVRDTWDMVNGRVVFDGVRWSAEERRRREADVRLSAGLVNTLGAIWNPDTGMTVEEYSGDQPRKVTIEYPAGLPDHDLKWREQVADLVRERMGADDVTATWVPASSKVIFVGLDWTPLEREHEEIQRRIKKFLTPLFRGAEFLDITVAEWSVQQEPVRIVLEYGTISQDATELFQRRVEVTTAVKLGGRWRAEFDPTKDTGILTPRPELPKGVIHPGVKLYTDPETKPDPKSPVLYYGVDENGDHRGWMIGKGSNMPHMLCIGPTGSGKTTVLRSLIVGAIMQGIPVFGCDPKRIELTPFRGFPGCFIASSAEDMDLMIRQMDALMEERYIAIENAIRRREKPPVFTPVLFILDELLILRQVLKLLLLRKVKVGNDPSATTARSWNDAVTALLALARSAGIHLVIGVQRPDAELFDAGARDNLRQRVSLMRLSPQGSQMLWGSSYVGVDLPMIQGRAMASPDGETPVEMQTYWVSDPITAEGADRDLIEQFRARGVDLFADWVPPFDVSDYVDFDADEQPASERPRALSDVDLGTRIATDEAPGLSARDEAALMSEDVQAGALTAGGGEEGVPGDQIIVDGQPCDVVDIDEDFSGALSITVRDAAGNEQTILRDAEEYVPRILNLEAVPA